MPLLYKCFNPYRVFKFAATSDNFSDTITIPKFQSLSGFQVRCNSGEEALASLGGIRFNPYRVFKFAATVG